MVDSSSSSSSSSSNGSSDSSSNSNDSVSSSSSSSPSESPPLQKRDSTGSTEWDRVKYAIDHLKPGAPLAGSSGNESSLRPGAAAVNSFEDDAMWQQALERYQQESNSRLNIESHDVHVTKDGGIPNGLDAHVDTADESLDARMNAMDTMGAFEVEQPPPHPADRAAATASSSRADHANLTLWQTFKLLYRRNRIIKLYLCGVVVLLIATAVVVAVFVTQHQRNQNDQSSSSRACAEASWQTEADTLLPRDTVRQGPRGSLETIAPGAFGLSVSLSSDHLLVGSPYLTCTARTANGDAGECQDFTLGGGASVYRRGNGGGDDEKGHWEIHATFYLDDGVSSGDQFGYSVAMSEDGAVAVMGAPKDDGWGVAAGAVYVAEAPFRSGDAPWRLVPEDIGANDDFGKNVGVSVTTLNADANANVDGDVDDSPVKVTNIVVGSAADDDSGSNSGGVYVFSKYEGVPPPNACGGYGNVQGNWVECQKLLPDDGSTLDRFGNAVDIADRTVVVGADWDDDRGIDSGSAYVYSLADDGIWTFQQKLLPTNVNPTSDRFGVSVATSGDRIVIGADLDDSYGEDSGAAYVYRLSKGVWKLESKLIPSGDVTDYSKHNCGSSVDISSDGNTIAVGCSGAPGGGLVYVYVLKEEGVWMKKDTLTVPSAYTEGQVRNLKLGHSVAVSPGDNSMVVSGYGELYGDVWSFAKDC
ncbi:hypothetical protein ACHAXS_004936 [Conticribra weissflogii]